MKNPILLLHGALGSKEQFELLQQKLSLESEVFRIDFEGHGKFVSITDFSIQLFTQNIIDFLEEKRLTRVDICGYSMGGYVALNLALKNPQFVGKIITLGTKFDWTPTFALKEITMLNPVVMKLKVPAFAKRLEELHGAKNWENVVLKTAAMMVNLGDNPILREADYRKIINEVLICLGEFDKMSTQEESKNIADYLQNGQFLEIDNLKHPIESAPIDKIASIITNFLN